MLSILV